MYSIDELFSERPSDIKCNSFGDFIQYQLRDFLIGQVTSKLSDLFEVKDEDENED